MKNTTSLSRTAFWDLVETQRFDDAKICAQKFSVGDCIAEIQECWGNAPGKGIEILVNLLPNGGDYSCVLAHLSNSPFFEDLYSRSVIADKSQLYVNSIKYDATPEVLDILRHHYTPTADSSFTNTCIWVHLVENERWNCWKDILYMTPYLDPTLDTIKIDEVLPNLLRGHPFMSREEQNRAIECFGKHVTRNGVYPKLVSTVMQMQHHLDWSYIEEISLRIDINVPSHAPVKWAAIHHNETIFDHFYSRSSLEQIAAIEQHMIEQDIFTKSSWLDYKAKHTKIAIEKTLPSKTLISKRKI